MGATIPPWGRRLVAMRRMASKASSVLPLSQEGRGLEASLSRSGRW